MNETQWFDPIVIGVVLGCVTLFIRGDAGQRRMGWWMLGTLCAVVVAVSLDR